MNTRPAARLAPRLFALASAAFFTLAMLAAVNGLATSEPSASLVAQVMGAKKV